MPMGRLAETLACDASNVTGLVDRLESRGLVRRQPSAADRRVEGAWISRRQGLACVRPARSDDGASRQPGSAVIEEQQALVRILRRLLD